MEGHDEAGAELTIDVPGPLPESTPTLEPPAPTPTPSRAAQGLDGHRRLLWTGPFATLSTGTTPWGMSSDDGDVTMASASPGRDTPGGEGRLAAAVRPESGRITNAPSLPAAPRYAGSTMKDRRVFMRAYETYYHALSAFDTGFGRPFIMPVSGCIEERTCKMICMYEFQKGPNEVSESDWIAYFLQAREPELEDYTTVDAAMKNLTMQTSFPDAASRMGPLRADMHRILDEHTVEQVMLEREQKKVVKYFVAALEPPDFREAIKKRLGYEQHKALKSDIVKCYAWILDQLKAYLVWQPPLVSGKTQSRPQSKTSSMQHRQQGGGGNKPHTAGGAASGAATDDKAGHLSSRPPRKPRDGDRDGPPSRRACLKCGSLTHLVRQCPGITSEEVEKLLAARMPRGKNEPNTGAKRVQVVRDRDASADTASSRTLVDTGSMVDDDGTAQATIDGFTLQASLLDSGADDSVVSGGIVRALETAGVTINQYPMSKALEPVGGHLIRVVRKVRFGEVEFETSAGPLLLRNLDCLVHEEDRTLSLTIGRPVMSRLGYSTDGLLAAARARQPEYELLDTAKVTPDQSALVRLQAMRARALEKEGDDSDELDDLVASPSLEGETTRAVQEALELKLKEAAANGLPSYEGEQLRDLLFRYVDVFRLSFGNDPPVRVPPLRVRLKEGARAVKAKARRYPPDHKRYLEQHIQELVRHGLVVENHRSRWASAPRIVAKRQPGEYRMTVDTRAVNALTEPMPWPMPDMESDLAMVEDSDSYFTIDWWRGYWQLPLDEDSQELYTIMTHRGMFTPTRVLMGCTDAVAYCQGVVEMIFGPLLSGYILAWLDDILGYARSPAALIVVLRKVLELCEKFGLKLHPLKCCFFTREATWCGRMISANGVRHCPTRVEGLVNLPAPRTAGELQQFLCAANWMRGNIPEYNALTASLYEVLESAATIAQSRMKTRLNRVLLSSVGWTAEHETALANVKEALLKMVTLAHPKPDWEVCLFADASQTHYGAVVTQIPPEDVGLPVHEQRHHPLAFLSGSFTGSMLRWSTIDKEAYAIVISCKRLLYLLLRPRGFRIFTDHRNLQYVFDPLAVNSSLGRHQVDRLQRWAMTLTAFQYVIEHVRGEENVWGDLLSRWGAGPSASTPAARMSTLLVVERVSPLQDEAFIWPSQAEIESEQRRELADRDSSDTLPTCQWNSELSLYVTDSGKVWIPVSSVDLQQRLCVVAHAGLSGHRGAEATERMLSEKFEWPTLSDDTRKFVRGCLHCMVVGERVIPRPFGEALHASAPNEVLHFDFLSLPASTTGEKYVLVLKDDMSGFCELIVCEDPTAESACRCLMDWFMRFGPVPQWVSDRDTHFKNKLLELLRKSYGSAHHFTTAYCPWSNGSVEVVNRVLLKCLRAMLSELKLHLSNWPTVLPLVQSALNQTPSDRLGGVAPVTAFTALPASPPVVAILHPQTDEVFDVQVVYRKQRQHIGDVQAALEDMHRAVTNEAEKRRQQARDRRAARTGVKMANFEIGDFVLVAQVTGRANKLAVHWRGPRRVVGTINDHIFQVQDLSAPFHVATHHASRLRLYAEADREVTEDLVAQAMHGDGGHLVAKMLDCRLGQESHVWEILVEWIGLDPLEASWEPAAIMYEDVPQIVETFVKAQAADSSAHVMWTTLLEDRPAPKAKTKSKRKEGSRKRG